MVFHDVERGALENRRQARPVVQVGNHLADARRPKFPCDAAVGFGEELHEEGLPAAILAPIRRQDVGRVGGESGVPSEPFPEELCVAPECRPVRLENPFGRVLVHEVDVDDGRVVLPGKARVGVDMAEEVRGEGEKIGLGRPVGPDERLVVVPRKAVGGLRKRGCAAERVEVERDVDATPLEGGGERVEPREHGRIEFAAAARGECAVVVVQADDVVAHAGEVIHKVPEVVALDEVGAEAEVRAVEPLRHPR